MIFHALEKSRIRPGIVTCGLYFLAMGSMTMVSAAPMPSPHPSYTLSTIRPSDFQPSVSGMDMLPDGRLLVMTHEAVRANPVKPGAIYTVEGVKGSGPYIVKKVVSNTFSGTGMLIHEGMVYITEKDRLVEIQSLESEFTLDRAVDALPGKYRTIHKYGWDNNYHQYAFGPVYSKEADGKEYFYVALSTAWTEGLNKSKNRASLLKISKDGSVADIVLSGIRTPNGIGTPPDGSGEMFASDNQGGWVPVSKLNNIRPGRFYGFFNNAGGKYDNLPPSPPAVWMPHGGSGISNSPTDPTFLKTGPYKGNVIVGDLYYGGLQRIFLEKIDNEFQGAAFRFSGGMEAAINQIVLGDDGTLYLGGMGSTHCACWLWPGGKIYGLQKLTPNGKATYDFLSVRSMGPTSIKLEFTEPVNASAAATASNYTLKHWHYTPSGSYGGPPQGTTALTVKSATVAPDGLSVTLDVGGLAVGKVVHVLVSKSVTSSTGGTLWQNEAWYTMNKFGPGTAIETGPVATRSDLGNGKVGFNGLRGAVWNANGLRFAAPVEGPWNMEIRNAMGKVLRVLRGERTVSELDLAGNEFSSGIYWLVLNNPSGRHSQKVMRH